MLQLAKEVKVHIFGKSRVHSNENRERESVCPPFNIAITNALWNVISKL